MTVNAQTRSDTGVQYDLGTSKNLLVGSGVVVRSLDTLAVSGTGNGQRVTVSGTVEGYGDGIGLTGDNAVVLINKGGAVRSLTDDCINFEGKNVTLINRGLLSGNYGVYLQGEGGTEKISNYGAILVDRTAVLVGAISNSVLRNFGTILSEQADSFEGNGARDILFNRGTMIGDVTFSAGNDVYNGLNGRIFGTIYGGNGADVFRPGLRGEQIDGGADFDTLDFRGGAGVRVDLGNTVGNTGSAKNDTYTAIERVFGSTSGADQLRSDGAATELFGFGGADKLMGNNGDDILSGGTGRDTMTGGNDSDSFTFETKDSAGDVITDFGIGNDTVTIRGDAFGAGLSDGFLAAGRFKSGANNLAGDANDRFIFNTATDKLYFDADGTGSGAAILVAAFTGDVAVTAGDIYIY